MKRLFYFLLPALLFMNACTDDVVYQKTDELTNKVVADSYKIPLKDALVTAEGVLNDINPKTRGSLKQVASVDYVCNSSVKTRSGAADTLMYLVNYADNGGFALLSADKRLAPVYAISDEGHLEMSDTINNPPLSVWMNSTLNSIQQIIIGGDSISLKETIVRELSSWKYPYFRGKYEKLVKWHQNKPFNEFCFYSDGSGKKAPVGCVALATGTVMAYNCWPEEQDGEEYNWTDILRYDESESATADTTWRNPAKIMLRKFLRNLGNREYLYITYGNNRGESSASQSRIQPTFEAWGYERPLHMPFTDDNAVVGLSEGPIIICGYGELWDYEDGEYYDSGHAWVIDGYLQYSIYKAFGNPNYPVRKEFLNTEPPLYHCVWGWGVENNGFFYWTHDEHKYFDPSECEMKWPQDQESGPNPPKGTYDDVGIYYHFKPIK